MAIESSILLAAETIINTKVDLLYGVFVKFPSDVREKLTESEPFVIMTSCLSQIPHLKIESDQELLAIQDKLCKKIKGIGEKSNTIYVAIYSQFGDTCDSHSRLLGYYNDYKIAEQEVFNDMDTYIESMEAEPAIVNRSKHEIWMDETYNQGCIWDIHEINLTKERK